MTVEYLNVLSFILIALTCHGILMSFIEHFARYNGIH